MSSLPGGGGTESVHVNLVDPDIPAAMTAQARRRMDVGVIMLAVVALASTQLEAGSPVRALVVLAAFLLVPGWALVSLLNSGPPAAMLGLAIGLSLAIDVAGSLVLVWTERFEVLSLGLILGTPSVMLLIGDLVLQSRSPRADVPAPPQAAG